MDEGFPGTSLTRGEGLTRSPAHPAEGLDSLHGATDGLVHVATCGGEAGASKLERRFD
jgi:hypothetical protein